MSAHIASALLLLCCIAPVWTGVEEDAKKFLDEFNTEAVPIVYASSLASWAYNTNITDENEDKMVRIQTAISNQGWKKREKKPNKKNTKADIVRVGIRCVCFYVHQSAAGKRWSDFYANKSKEAEKFEISNITDPEIKLQLISLQDKGSTALPADKAAKVAHRFGFGSNYELQYVSQNEKNLHIDFTI